MRERVRGKHRSGAFSPRVQQIAPAPGLTAPSAQQHVRPSIWAALTGPGGSQVQIRPLLSAFAASLIVFTPCHALAQTQAQPDDNVSVRERPRPEYDPLGLRFGSFTANAQLDLGATSTDNLFAQSSGAEQDDIVYTVSPNVQLKSDWSRHALEVQAGARFTNHQDFSSEDANSHYVRAVGRLDVGTRTSISATAGIAHEVEPRTDPDSPVTLDPVEYDRTEASLNAQHTFNRFRVSGGVARTEYSFDGSQSFRDNEETVARGRLDAELTPRIGVLLQATADERDYDRDVPFDLDSSGRTVLAGVTINFTDLMRGEFSVGQFSRDYDDPGIGTVDGLAASGDLDWYITRLTTLHFSARRNAESVVGGGTGAPFVETTYGARVDHELLRNVILTAGVQAGKREYDNIIDRKDDFVYGEAGADYIVNRRVSLRARYNFDQVDSSGVDAYRDYDVNAFTLGVTLRL